MKKVLFISVHPDDETLGCGGTILNHRENGDEIYWLIITNAFLEQGYNEDFLSRRSEEISKVEKAYNFSGVYCLNFKTTELDCVPLNDLTEHISKAILKIKPEIIYLQNRSDIHSDHRIAFDATMSAVKSFRNPFIEKILMFECISETEITPALPENIFIPNYFVDISRFMDRKIEIMKIYSGELGYHPFPRSIRNIQALATFRGTQCGAEYAESFMILKDIWR